MTATDDRLALLNRGKNRRAVRDPGMHHEDRAPATIPGGPDRIDPAAFTGTDADRLAALENALDQAGTRAQAGIDMMKGWLDEQRGIVLHAIHESDLYKVKAATFEDYVSERWDMSRPRAYALMTAAPVLRVMSSIEDTRPVVSQALALAPVYERDGERGVREALREAGAAAKTAGKRVTAATLKQTVRSLGYATTGQHVDGEDRAVDGHTAAARVNTELDALAGSLERLGQRLDKLLAEETAPLDQGRAIHDVNRIRRAGRRFNKVTAVPGSKRVESPGGSDAEGSDPGADR